jgi:glycosyltransferase involved in cell wall biosynthesis
MRSPVKAERAGPETRLLHLIKGLGRGGAEMLLLETRRVARTAPFVHTYGYLLPAKDALVRPLRELGSEVTCFPMRSALSLPATVLGLTRYLRRSRTHLVHAHLPVAGVVARLAGRLARVPVLYTEHNLHERYHPLTRRLNLWTWGLQERVLAVSQPVGESIVGHAGDRVPVEVVRNGIPTDRYRPDPAGRTRMRHRLEIPETAPLIGTTAVFRPQKRLGDWLRVGALLRSLHPEVRFLLVGDGPLRPELERLAGKLGFGDALRWAGLQEDVRPWLAAMDVYVQSSDYEGLPVGLLEAMATGLPVVATAVGGVPEVVTEATGRLVPPRRPAALAEATAALLTDVEARRRMGQEGRRRVREHFDVRRMQRRLEEIYLELVPGERDV